MPRHSPISQLFWALAYLLLFFFFNLSASPLIASQRKRWSPYAVVYFLASLWMACGIIGTSSICSPSASFFLSSVDAPSSFSRPIFVHILFFFSLLQGHTPFWDNTFDFNADEPASLLMPLFWSSLTLLLLVDLLHFRCQRLTKRLKLTTLTRFCSTKIRLTFGQTFSEAAMSSLVVAAFCCMLHARNLTLQQNENYDQDLFQLLIDSNQHDRVLQYARCFLEIETMPPWMSSPIFGVWMSCLSILVVHHWFDRTCEERGWF